MESKSSDESPSPSPISRLYATCLRENKTAVISFGELEIHLVAMTSRANLNKFSTFWAFSAPVGLYCSCITMLNLRCLGIVFDLDETLIVANTMRSFEDRIDALQRKINTETDPQRVAGMLAEVKRYQDDKSVLKQYVDNDQVVENGKVFKTQSEEVPPLSDGQQSISRPLIRLQEKNIILTRVNPAIRDTSVLVRLRPGWDELRSYLTARGRKRFEVYVCTMAERDYALEMWRLLDPESNLISGNQLLNRIVCVKSGLRKSLLNVFQNITCHPRMALVIDDRMKVWDDKDQPRVHVVPAFTPYYAPQAETNSTVPVLCVARNVACNVRGNFFKEFDDGLLPHISKICYEDDMSNFPSAPDVGNYLISEDETCPSVGNKDPLCFESVADVEVDKRLKEANVAQPLPAVVNNIDPRLVHCLPHNVAVSSSIVSQAAPAIMPPVNNQYPSIIAPVMPMGHPGLPEPAFQGSPAREEGEVPESELDPDTRRRLLILQHGQDTRDHTSTEPPISNRQPLQGTVPSPIQPHGSWFPMDENLSPRRPNRTTLREYPSEPEPFHFDKKRSNHSSSFFRGMENSGRADRGFQEIQRFSKRVYRGDRRFGVSSANYDSFRGEEMPDHISSSRDVHFEARRITQYSETPTAVLEEIGNKCGAKVEFKTALVDTPDLQFSVEVWFVGEKICESSGRTRKEAQRHAAESSLRILANKYLSDSAPEPSSTHGDLNKFSHGQENGFPSDLTSFGYSTHMKGDNLPVTSRSTSAASASALKELCIVEGLDLVFQPRPSLSVDPLNEGEVYVQAEVDGQVLGKGIGMTWEEAKLQASEEALANLKSSYAQFAPKHVSTPRSLQMAPNKRLKADFSRDYQRTHSSRYLKNENFVP